MLRLKLLGVSHLGNFQDDLDHRFTLFWMWQKSYAYYSTGCSPPLSVLRTDNKTGGVLVDESRDGMNAKPERWWETLESKGFTISCTKTEYMNRNFGGDGWRDATLMRIEAQEILQRESIRYLGFVISKDGEIEEDVEYMIRGRWLNLEAYFKSACDWLIIVVSYQ